MRADWGVTIGMLSVLVRIETDPEEQTDQLERAVRQVRGELAELDVEAVHAVEADPPPGSKGVAAAVGGVLVSIGGSGLLPAIIATLRDWLGRSSAPNRVVVTIAGDTIELDRADTDQQQALVEAFLRRHGAE